MSKEEKLLDKYGFEITCTKEHVAARIQSDKLEQAQLLKWGKFVKQGKLPPRDKLKKYCRKVPYVAI